MRKVFLLIALFLGGFALALEPVNTVETCSQVSTAEGVEITLSYDEVGLSILFEATTEGLLGERLVLWVGERDIFVLPRDYSYRTSRGTEVYGFHLPVEVVTALLTTAPYDTYTVPVRLTDSHHNTLVEHRLSKRTLEGFMLGYGSTCLGWGVV